MKKHIGIFIVTAIIAVVLLVANLFIYRLPGLEGAAKNFIYTLPVVYLFFFVFTIIILGVLVIIGKKRNEQLGYIFLFLTSAKMGLSYLFARPILAKTIDDPTEKINFFIVFILFLAIEAYYTARLLNNK
ncbi:hypothetical protein E0W68_06820 [Flavobacterium salilacus subsp. salilacus]|uniref:DUF6168 family protein n=1 Tax=Flavobacterium TaxID=237 RepID=UPI0010751692|nr:MULTISPECIES: DUF6168 family protein [Flavobacterium]KAF2518964.1 hypothetical protein E0W68_06820 [Flavobacterium salilacus subsp. salilacus]MBE1614874.1 hypothetical protein [Flavobacterium sp. SaA2.13]